MNQREECLEEANRLVNGARNVDYDEPSVDFARTAKMWEAYFGFPVAPHDVAAAQILLKVSRISASPQKFDHWVDVAGYAACGADTKPDSA